MIKGQVYTTEICEVFWDERGFIRLNLFETQNAFNLNQAKKQIEIASLITKGAEYKVLIDTRGSNALPDKKAQDFITNAQLRIAEAIIVSSLPMRILSNFYLKKNKNNKVKIFSKEKNAVDWLLACKKD